MHLLVWPVDAQATALFSAPMPVSQEVRGTLLCVLSPAVFVKVLSVQGLKHQQEAEPSTKGSFSVLSKSNIIKA